MINNKINNILETKEFYEFNVFPKSRFWISFIALVFAIFSTLYEFKKASYKNAEIIIGFLFIIFFIYWIYILYFKTVHKIFITDEEIIFGYKKKTDIYQFKNYIISHKILSSWRGPSRLYFNFLSSDNQDFSVELLSKTTIFLEIINILKSIPDIKIKE